MFHVITTASFCQEGHQYLMTFGITQSDRLIRMSLLSPEHRGQVQLAVSGKLSARRPRVPPLAFGQCARRRQLQPKQEQQQQDQSERQGESMSFIKDELDLFLSHAQTHRKLLGLCKTHCSKKTYGRIVFFCLC